MNSGKMVFSQIMDFFPMNEFRKCVKRYNGNYKVRKFTCLDQFLCMAFAQLTFRESLRDIEACLRAMETKLYHLGIRGKISRSTLAEANEKRDWRIYADFAQALIHTAKKLYINEPFGVDLKKTVYALDATTIKLCLSLFPWSHFRLKQGAIKLHTLLSLHGNIPSLIRVTAAKVPDTTILDEIQPEAGSFYILDRGYLDFSRLFAIHQTSAFFVVRSKLRIVYRRMYSHPVDKATGLCSDQTVYMGSIKGVANHYPEKIRRIRFYDSVNNNYMVFLTNNFNLPAITITELYKCRWQIELFFKWIKQHLRIKAFYGTSENAVKIQIWIAISTYVLIAIIKKQLKIEHSLYTMLQILSITIFEKTPILRALAQFDCKSEMCDSRNQLLLFDL
ncbi:MAG: IS4 family transposase [Candidatus Omnitrophota bacterium]